MSLNTSTYFCVMMRCNIFYNLHDLSNVWIKLFFDTFITLFVFFNCNELWVNISVKSGKVCTSSLQRVRLRLLVDCLNWRFGECPLPGNSPCKSAKSVCLDILIQPTCNWLLLLCSCWITSRKWGTVSLLTPTLKLFVSFCFVFECFCVLSLFFSSF